MTTMDEKELRKHFQRLRDADRETAPGFAQTYARARAPRSMRATARPRTLAIVAAAAVLIVAVWMERVGSFARSETVPAIATWRAPTDVLLDTPGSELLAAMPALGSSVLDKMFPTHSMRGT